LNCDVGCTGRVENSVSPGINVPGAALVGKVASGELEPQVGLVVDIHKVERGQKTRSALECLGEGNVALVSDLWLVPWTDIHSVVGTANNVGTIIGERDPGGVCAVKGRVSPSVDVEDKALLADIGHVCLAAPVGVVGHIELVEPYEDAWHGVVSFGEGDLAGGLLLWFVPCMIVLGAELAKLEVAVLGVDLEPGATGRVESGVTPSVEVDAYGVGFDIVGESVNANVV